MNKRDVLAIAQVGPALVVGEPTTVFVRGDACPHVTKQCTWVYGSTGSD